MHILFPHSNLVPSLSSNHFPLTPHLSNTLVCVLQKLTVAQLVRESPCSFVESEGVRYWTRSWASLNPVNTFTTRFFKISFRIVCVLRHGSFEQSAGCIWSSPKTELRFS